jgi:hypothetical protein
MVKNIIILQDIQESEKKSSDLFLILLFCPKFSFHLPFSQSPKSLVPKLRMTMLGSRPVHSSSSSSCLSRSKRRHPSSRFLRHSRRSSDLPRSVQAVCYQKWSHDISDVYAFQTIDEIDPKHFYVREVDDIHIVLQASLIGFGGFVETDIIYAKHSLTSGEKVTITDHVAVTRCVRSFYLRCKAPSCEVFQPEIDVERCTLLGRRTVGLTASNSTTSFSVQGIAPESNRWIIPFSSQVSDGYRFYIINRFYSHRGTKSAVRLWLMAAMYPLSRTSANSFRQKAEPFIAKNFSETWDSGDQRDPIVIDETEGCHDPDEPDEPDEPDDI